MEQNPKKPPKPPKGSALQEEREDTPTIIYSDEEKEYIRRLQKRLDDAKKMRDQAYEEFDGMSWMEYWHSNERWANTMLRAKKNKSDVTFQSGTLRTKMMAFLASFLGLNLKPDISAFNDSDIPLNTLGQAMVDIIEKTEEWENDEEKRMLRQYELLKHGTVFVEDMWIEQWETEKKVIKGFMGNVSGVKWSTKKKRAKAMPRRRIISMPKIYLGSMREYFIENQPYIFTVELMDRSKAESIYGNWERWKYVSRKKRDWTGAASDAMVYNAWRLNSNLGEDLVEVIRYQDKPNNEFQIILNGVPMLPMGFPLTEISPDGEYTIVQQNLEPIREDFAIGKSFIFKNKNIVQLLDEMMRLAVLKTQKSFMPPYLNLSGRVISPTIFMPGKITRGILPNEIQPLSEKEAQGVTASEFQMIQEVIKFIDQNTASQTFTGSKEWGGKVTATQIIELQRQARIMMGIMILAASLLEKKLAIKRMGIILKHWFDPIDEEIDEARKELRRRYRTISVARILDEGPGIRIVSVAENLPTAEEIATAEEQLGQALGGIPTQIIMLNPNEIKQAKLTWVVNVSPKEKRSSEYSKLLFETMVQGAMNLGLRLNQDYIEKRYAEVWEEDPAKMFEKQPEAPPQPVGPPPAGGQAVKGAVPKVEIKPPTPQVGSPVQPPPPTNI